MNYKELRELIYNYPTKSKWGFTNDEIKQLLETNFKDVEFNQNKYNDAMMGNTCMMEDNEIINYHCDVLKGISCGLENRNLKWNEFD